MPAHQPSLAGGNGIYGAIYGIQADGSVEVPEPAGMANDKRMIRGVPLSQGRCALIDCSARSISV